MLPTGSWYGGGAGGLWGCGWPRTDQQHDHNHGDGGDNVDDHDDSGGVGQHWDRFNKLRAGKILKNRGDPHCTPHPNFP